MSKKAKRQASSLSFSMSRWFRKLSASKPSSMTIALIVIAFATFLFSGGLLTLIDQPPISIYTGSKFYFLYPALDGQFVMDTFFSAMLYVVGLVGLLLMYRSSKSAFKPRQAYMMFLVGVVLVFLSYILLETTIELKLK